MALVALLGLAGWRRRMWLLAVAALFVGTIGCAGDAVSGELACTRHSECPGGWMCGLDSTCIPEVGCGADDDCCPGAICFNEWCRPTSFCDLGADPDRPCLQRGFACEVPWNASAELTGAEVVAPGAEGGWCTPMTCEAHGDCPGGFRCTAGRCLGATALPCAGACGSDEACHLPTGRCLVASGCQTCVGDEIRVVTAASPLTALACGADRVECECAPPPEPPSGRPGREPQLVVMGSEAMVLSYEPVYGDLVLTRAPLSDLADQQDAALDGLPAGVTDPLDGYRGGAFEPGPDRGVRPSLTVLGGEIHAVHQDRDLSKARYTRTDALGEVTVSFELPIAGVAGRYSCIAHEPSTGNPVALVFVESDQGASKLVQARASTPEPMGPSDFNVVTVLERELPMRSQDPCAGGCGPLDLCVEADGVQACASLFDSLSCDGPPCPAHHVCASVEAGVEPACLPRVYRAFQGDDIPFGSGLYVSCAANDAQAVASYYDRDVGALYALQWPWVSSTPQLVDGTEAAWDAPDVGAHAEIALSPASATSGIAYWDGTAGALKFAEGQAGAGSWLAATVHADAVVGSSHDLGAWASLAYTGDGEPIIGYSDAGRADVLIASRSASGCWQTVEVLSSGAYATPDIALSDVGGVIIAARELVIDEQLRPQHALILTTIPRPVCSSN